MDHSTDQTESSSTSSASANAVDQEAATDNTVLIRGMDLDVFNAAKEGKTDVLKRRHHLDQILTPTKNTVLHIYIAFASSPNFIQPKEKALRPPSIVDKILQMCPALLSQKNESGETALHIAARYGRADIVERLIETAKAGRREDLENGPSSSAVEARKMLIRETNNEKDTALHFAVRFNHFDVVKKLTREDPDFSYSANDAGETPLYLAAERKYNDLFSVILSACTDPNYQGPNGRTALHAAAIYGDEEMTKEILEKKKDLAIAADEKGWTPLHYAAFYGRASIVTQLLEADKCSAYMGDEADKKTALHIAASNGHVRVMKQLISCCPDCCEVVDQRRRNALHYALEKRQSRIVDIIMMDTWLSNILLNAKDVDGNTPLHLLGGPVSLFISDDRVDKMAFNTENMNALDVIKTNDDVIWKMLLTNALKRNGATSGHRILIENNHDGQKLKENKGGEDTETNKNKRESHLIVATLVATVTFAAGVAMPGGYYQGDASDQGNGMSNVSQQNVTAPALSNRPTPGYAVLTKSTAFRSFYLFNMAALCLSTYSVLMHLFVLTLPEGKERSKRFWRSIIYTTIMSVVAMMIAFTSGIYAVLGDSPVLAKSGLIVVGYVFTLFVYVQMVEVQSVNSSILRYKLTRLFARIKIRRHID